MLVDQGTSPICHNILFAKVRKVALIYAFLLLCGLGVARQHIAAGLKASLLWTFFFVAATHFALMLLKWPKLCISEEGFSISSIYNTADVAWSSIFAIRRINLGPMSVIVVQYGDGKKVKIRDFFAVPLRQLYASMTDHLSFHKLQCCSKRLDTYK